MKYLALVCRILLGLGFVIFGAEGLHDFMHQVPPPVGNPAGDWVAIMHSSGWMQVISALELIGGVLVLIGGTLPLGLCILCPISLNAMLFHFCLMHGAQVAPAAFTAMLELVLIWAYRANFNNILTTRAVPLPRPS